MAISKRLRRALRTGLQTGTGILGAQQQAAQLEEERRQKTNRENIAQLLGLSLVEEREARTEKLRREPEKKSTIQYKIDIAPGFSATAKSLEDLEEIATGMGEDPTAFLGGITGREEPSKTKISGRTAGGTVSGPVDQATEFIEAMGGIVPPREERPARPTNINQIYAGAGELAVVAAGGEDVFDKLSLTEKRERIDFFARQLWEQQNPGIPFKPIEFPPEAEPEPEQPGGFMNFIKGLFGGGEAAAPAQQEDPEIAKANQKLESGEWDQAKYDRFIQFHQSQGQ